MRLSGYTTIRNAKSMGYPFIESIKSMLSFCDEVVVCDSSSCEETIQALSDLADQEPKLIIVEVDIPWEDPNHGVYDGQTKGLARAECTGDVLWQMDADEVVHENDGPIIRDLAKNFFEASKTNSNLPPVFALPVIEFWGPSKIRADINPWKPRMSLNDPRITHGIPKSLMKIEDGLVYAKHGTDGCDYIYEDTLEPVPMTSSYTQAIENQRLAFLRNPTDRELDLFVRYLADWVKSTPGVYHYSWYSIPEKIFKYKHFWNNSWKSLYNENRDPNWNPFTNEPLDDLTDKQIVNLGRLLEDATGGWIFHQKWDGSKRPSIPLELANKFNLSHPEVIKEWRKAVDLKKEVV